MVIHLVLTTYVTVAPPLHFIDAPLAGPDADKIDEFVRFWWNRLESKASQSVGVVGWWNDDERYGRALF